MHYYTIYYTEGPEEAIQSINQSINQSKPLKDKKSLSRLHFTSTLQLLTDVTMMTRLSGGEIKA